MAGSENASHHRLGLTPALQQSAGALTGRLFVGAWAVARARHRRFLGGLVLLTVAVLGTHAIDHPTLRWLATWRTPEVVSLAKQISFWGELHLVPLAIVLAAWGWAEWRQRHDFRLGLAAAALALAFSGLAVQVLKFIFGRPRPHLPVPDQLAWFNLQWDSFPSGHAMHWGALVGALGVLSPRLGAWCAPLAVIVMAARLLVPRHYPTDLLAGVTLGLMVGVCFGLAARELNHQLGRPAAGPRQP
jgi:undecaprenyl-diphosphatase